MTEPLLEPEEISPQSQSSIQCDLCLNEIVYELGTSTPSEIGHAVCPKCNYHQPLTKTPRRRDLAVFGVAISVVYITTIVAVFLTR